MSYTPGSGGKIQVGIDAGMTASVTILRKFGGALTVYSDAARTAPVSIPATITANTIFYLDTDDIYTISCISNGVECCSISGVIQVHTKNINGDHQVGCSVDRETSEIAITGNGITLAQANAAYLAAGLAPSGTPGARRRKYDVRDYLGSDDFGAAVNRAIAAAGADLYAQGAAGQVVMPPVGTVAVSTPISWLQSGTTWHGVDLIGAGWGKTILQPQGIIAAINSRAVGGSSALQSVTIANFEIDGSVQTLTSGSYSAATKGTYMQYLRRCLVQHLYIHDTAATGLGNDFHDDCLIDDILAVDCGRLNPGTGGGGAGIGIGTGVYLEEILTVRGCRTNSNKVNGIFFETQTGVFSYGVKVIEHAAAYNGAHGIADAGCRGMHTIGGVSRNNGLSGFAAYAGTVSSSAPGIGGKVMGLETFDNTENGVHIDWSVRRPGASYTGYDPITSASTAITPTNLGYTIDNVTARGNTKHGVLVQPGNTAGTGDTPDMAVRDCTLHANGQTGVALSSANAGAGGAAVRPLVLRNRIFDNGTTGTNKYGILFNANLVDAQIRQNRTWDDQGGSATQANGIASTSITISGNSIIEGNDLRGNGSTGMVLTSATISSPTVIRDNPGYNPQGSVVDVTPGTSPWTYTAGASPETVYIDSGAVNPIKKNGLNIFTSTNKTVVLGPYEQIIVTWTSTPTIRVDKR